MWAASITREPAPPPVQNRLPGPSGVPISFKFLSHQASHFILMPRNTVGLLKASSSRSESIAMGQACMKHLCQVKPTQPCRHVFS